MIFAVTFNGTPWLIPARFISVLSDSPARYSIARKYVPFSSPKSNTVQTFGWSILAVSLASARNIRTKLRSFASRSSMVFRATHLRKPPCVSSCAR
jgi:hypothetical protein